MNARERGKDEDAYRVDQETGCWVWLLATNEKGYGRVRRGEREYKAHRYFYEKLVGPIPTGYTIDHLCRNRGCVNPEHLEAVTHRENLLRGDTITARNAAKTHCPQGHPLSGENLVITAKGTRGCRACRTASNERAWIKRRAA